MTKTRVVGLVVALACMAIGVRPWARTRRSPTPFPRVGIGHQPRALVVALRLGNQCDGRKRQSKDPGDGPHVRQGQPHGRGSGRPGDRCDGIKAWPDDAWQQGNPEEHPQAWLRVYDEKMEPTFTTAIRGVTPMALCELDPGRFMIVGRSHGTLQIHKTTENGNVEESEQPNSGVAILREPIVNTPQGGDDGYSVIVRDVAE